MAFDPAALDVLAHTNRGFTDWRYETPDAIEDVLEAYYFNEAAPQFREGDWIRLSTGGKGHGALIVLDVGTRAGDHSPYVRVSGLVLVQG